MSNLTVGSLFAGIGGFDLAATWAGYDISWQVEINEYCVRILSRHWPDVPKYRDVCACTGYPDSSGRDVLAPVDVMVGGFPCQDISTAGRGAGIAPGTRSGLWWEMARLIGELRPRIVVLENVPAIAIRGGLEVVGSLAALGYDCRWGLIRASDAGAPHRRERWFCVAYGNQPERKARSAYRMGEGTQTDTSARYDGLEHPAGRRRQQRDTGVGSIPQLDARCAEVEHGPGIRRDRLTAQPGSIETGAGKGRLQEPTRGSSWETESRLGGATDGLPAGLDTTQWPAGPGPQFDYEPPRVSPAVRHRAARLRALGNAVVPAVVYPLMLMVRAWLEVNK